MPKCPKCDGDVAYLVNRVAELHSYGLRMEGDSPQYEEHDWEPVGQGDYLCPDCTQVLFKDEDEALAFLKGKA